MSFEIRVFGQVLRPSWGTQTPTIALGSGLVVTAPSRHPSVWTTPHIKQKIGELFTCVL